MLRTFGSCILLAALSACATRANPAGDPAGTPIVALDAGALAGTVAAPGGVLAFQGIPYAAPPVGDGRWRAPAPLARWDGVLTDGRAWTCSGPLMLQEIERLRSVE